MTLNIIKKYYSSVLSKYSSDYFTLSNEYGSDNYALTNIIDIIVHIIKRFTCFTLYGTILKALTKYVMMKIPNTNDNQDIYVKNIMEIIYNIVNDTQDIKKSSKLLYYIFEEMPLKIVKNVLQIYEGPDSELDVDRETTNEQLFKHINTILESSSIIDIPQNSTLSIGLKDYVFDYYIEYMELFIKEMYNIMSNYLKSLEYQTKIFDMLEIVINKAKIDKAKIDKAKNNKK